MLPGASVASVTSNLLQALNAGVDDVRHLHGDEEIKKTNYMYLL